MTKKDTILIAVVINAGLLAILFLTAVIYDTDGGNEQIEFTSTLVADNKNSSVDSSTLIAAASTGDEVDNVLKYYTPPVSQPIEVQTLPEVYVSEPVIVQPSHHEDREEVLESNSQSSQERFIEVKVKRGDVLEKIAKSNKTTVGAIKRVNHLENELLSIGQVLKIPVKPSSAAYANAIPESESKIEVKQPVPKEPKSDEPVYYVVKSGDNPWKIAKQFGIKYDEILRLNHLDEDKARNLKIGDRIRVK